MAEISVNYRIEQAKLRSQISQLESNVHRQKLEALEIMDRVEKHRENIASTQKALVKLREQLAEHEKQYGNLEKDI